MIINRERFNLLRTNNIRAFGLYGGDGITCRIDCERDLLDTIEALTQTIAELTAKLDEVRRLAVDEGPRENLIYPAEILRILDAPDLRVMGTCRVNSQPHEMRIECRDWKPLDAPTKPKEARNDEE